MSWVNNSESIELGEACIPGAHTSYPEPDRGGVQEDDGFPLQPIWPERGQVGMGNFHLTSGKLRLIEVSHALCLAKRYKDGAGGLRSSSANLVASGWHEASPSAQLSPSTCPTGRAGPQFFGTSARYSFGPR